MNMTERCIEELKRAKLYDEDSDYGGMIGKAVEELLLVFQKQGHSGMSAQIVRSIFNELVLGKVLSPLTKDKSEWSEVEPGLLQNKRCFHVFWEPKVSVRPYTIDGCIFSDDGGKSYYTDHNSRTYFDLPGFPPEQKKVILEKED